MHPYLNIHEILVENTTNDGQEQVPSNDTSLEHQGWGQLVKTHVNQWPNTSPKSQSESCHLDDPHHKWPTHDLNLKVSPLFIPNFVSSTNVIVFPPTKNHLTILVVDSPSPAHNKPIDLEHPSHEETFVEKKLKEKEVFSVAHSKSSTSRPAITDEYLFTDIATHSVQFSYIF